MGGDGEAPTGKQWWRHKAAPATLPARALTPPLPGVGWGDVPPSRTSLAALESRDDKACVSYRAAWNHAIERTLCHVCEGDRP